MVLPALAVIILAAAVFALIFFVTSNMWEVLFVCAAAAITIVYIMKE